MNLWVAWLDGEKLTPFMSIFGVFCSYAMMACYLVGGEGREMESAEVGLQRVLTVLT